MSYLSYPVSPTLSGLYSAPFTIALKNIMAVSSGAPLDIGVIQLPSGISRWRLNGGTSIGFGFSYMYGETFTGALNGGSFTMYEGPSAGGQGLAGSASGPTATGAISAWAAIANVSYSTGIYIRQTANAGTTGLMSVYITVWPMP